MENKCFLIYYASKYTGEILRRDYYAKTKEDAIQQHERDREYCGATKAIREVKEGEMFTEYAIHDKGGKYRFTGVCERNSGYGGWLAPSFVHTWYYQGATPEEIICASFHDSIRLAPTLEQELKQIQP